MTESSKRYRNPRGGFTLVELLVSTGLVVMMMLMFATIFQLAAGSMSAQRGIAENDQRARTLTTIIKSDLDKRTFRYVLPFRADEAGVHLQSEVPLRQERRGYFYISENDPSIDSDDVLAFTMDSTKGKVSSDKSPFYGKARSLSGDVRDNNQPDWDDGDPGNGLGTSPYAEIVYFLRHGNLYRRIMLIREELPSAAPTGDQPINNAGNTFFNPATNYQDSLGGYPDASGDTAGDFWANFDYSAIYSSTGAFFLGSDALDNNGTSVPFRYFGHPRRRFGHNMGTTTPALGNPLEYIGSNFIGRFTHEETSHPLFNYPHSESTVGSGNPLDGTGLTYDTNTGVISNFQKPTNPPDPAAYVSLNRRAEDILMANVHSFDVKVWDTQLAEFVDIGHSLTGSNGENGDYHQARNQFPSYGPGGPAGNNVFDTWHPNLDFDNADGDNDYTTGRDQPPYRPLARYTPSNHPEPNPPPGGSSVGDLDPDGPDDGNGINGIDDNGVVPSDEAAEQGYPGSDDVRPLRAILITIRFLDTGSNQMRQLTLMHSLVD